MRTCLAAIRPLARPGPGARAWVVVAIAAAAASGFNAGPALAQEVKMTCQHQGKTYWVSYDPKQKLFRTNDPEAGSRFRIKRDQSDSDGVLVWVGAQQMGGERDLLAFFGNDTKWVRHFFGNGSQIMHRCQ
jgi:hypothetical protein